MAKATHKSNVFSWFGYIAKRRIETAPEDKEIIHRVLFEEIINNRVWCVKFGQMGSKVCQRHAEQKGWHGKLWGGGWNQFWLTEADKLAKKEKEREKARNYAKNRREHVNEVQRLYRERMKKEREELKNDLGTMGND